MILLLLACAAQADELIVDEPPAEIIEIAEKPAISTSGDPMTEQLMVDMKSMELFLLDKTQYQEHCAGIKWEQPTIDVYKEKLVSQLPEECKAKVPAPEPIEETK